MNFELRSVLPILLPRAIAWAEEREAEILSTGQTLNAEGLSIARGVGVTSPEHIRVTVVDRLPLPSDPQLQQAALATGLLVYAVRAYETELGF
jgi:hypothetical protein